MVKNDVSIRPASSEVTIQGLRTFTYDQEVSQSAQHVVSRTHAHVATSPSHATRFPGEHITADVPEEVARQDLVASWPRQKHQEPQLSFVSSVTSSSQPDVYERTTNSCMVHATSHSKTRPGTLGREGRDVSSNDREWCRNTNPNGPQQRRTTVYQVPKPQCDPSPADQQHSDATDHLQNSHASQHAHGQSTCPWPVHRHPSPMSFAQGQPHQLQTSHTSSDTQLTRCQHHPRSGATWKSNLRAQLKD
jgi:hypothetical protein